MEKSIRKEISNSEFEYILDIFSLEKDKRVNLKLELFEDPCASYLLLKSNIKTINDLEKRIRTVVGDINVIERIKKRFIVDEDLHLPYDLRNDLLESNSKIGLFIGAGVSKLLDIPLWEELASKAIEYLREKGDINFDEEIRIKNEKWTPKQILSIFHRRINDKAEIEKFYRDKLKGKRNKYGNPYELLYELEKVLARPLLKITTNLDLEWEEVLKQKMKEEEKNFYEDGSTKKPSFAIYTNTQTGNFTKHQEIREDVLYQIHGNINNLDEAIITISDYVEKYRDDNGLKGFLAEVFRNYTMIFIGSGLQEFEILEHVLKSAAREHYALVGTYWGDKNLFRVKKEYFSDLRIKVIPYYLDFHSYNRLIFVLQKWIEEIRADRAKRLNYYENIKLIDEVLNED